MANLRLSENNSSSLENCRARANYQNLILASKREVKSGSQMWHVYRLSENTKSDEFFFVQPIKALRYCFLLRKRSGAILPKGIYTKLMADVEASKAQAEQSALANAFEAMKSKHPDAVLLFRMGDFMAHLARMQRY